MSVATLTIDGKRYVVIPEEEYRRALGQRMGSETEMTDQNRGDVAELKRRKAREKPIPYAKARKMMGLA